MLKVGPKEGNIVHGKNPYNFRKANHIPAYCSNTANFFDKQPILNRNQNLFDVNKNIKDFKAISLGTWDEARICDIFNKNARKILGEEKAWHIHQFNSRSRYLEEMKLYSALGEPIEQGLTLWLDEQVTSCSWEELRATYHQVLQKFTTGWSSAKIEENPHRMFTNNPEDFCLFIKTPDKSSLSEEHCLINCLLSKFSQDDDSVFSLQDVSCAVAYPAIVPGEVYPKIYLWIRKSARDKVIDTLSLKLDRNATQV